jgi:hypothetical protein
MKRKDNIRKHIAGSPKKEDGNEIIRNSTVFLTIKPFIKGTFLFAEGCISESQTVRDWMMIRIYNN